MLDVACGSGKFPSVLVAHAVVSEAGLRPVEYDLLDPSAFSIAEACAALRPPFAPGAEFEVPMQAFERTGAPYDIVWANHALDAVRAAELDEAVARFVDAIGGTGFNANATGASHYLCFHRAFLDTFHGGEGELYRSSEDIVALLKRVSAKLSVREIPYAQESADDAVVEGFCDAARSTTPCRCPPCVRRAPWRSILPGAARTRAGGSSSGWR